MIDAILHLNTGEDFTTCNSVSNALNFLGVALVERSLTLGEVRENDEVLCTIRLLSNGSFQILCFDSRALNNLDINLGRPVQILQYKATGQSIATNITVGGSITFGNLTQE